MLRIGQAIKIRTLCLEYSDYKNIKGKVAEIEGDKLKVALPVKSLCEEDERELHKEGDKVFVKVNKEVVV